MQVHRRPKNPQRIEEGLPFFASAEDFAECRRLHRKYGTTYYLATKCFPAEIRRRTHAVYGFVRVADEWVDQPVGLSRTQTAELLEGYRSSFLRGMEGIRPEHPVLRAFCDVCREVHMPVEEPLEFLDAMAMDLGTTRYATYRDLQRYMRGSAAAVGVMMCSVIGAQRPETLASARKMGEAMQLTNFLRDIGEDIVRGRIYLPQEDLERFGVPENDLTARRVTSRFVSLMRFEIERARTLYRESEPAIADLPRGCRPAVLLASRLYSRILVKIEQNGYDVFNRRARTSNFEKGAELFRVLVGR